MVEGILENTAYMLVMLHSETCKSRRCHFEWSVAKEHSIPILCVVSSEDSADDVAAAQSKAKDMEILHSEIIKYTPTSSKESIQEIAAILRGEEPPVKGMRL